MTELEALYEKLLRPVFGGSLQIIHERDDFVHVILDGGREDFFFTLYGIGHLRLYWCNECFIFDDRRSELVSSDTYGEIVYEGRVNVRELPEMITGLVLQLNGCSYAGRQEEIVGRTPSGYDTVKNYFIRAKTESPQRPPYRLDNIQIEFDGY